jgi:circadian clock protein KaiB
VRDMEGKENCREQAPLQETGRKPVFCLYISGATAKSTQAITNLKPVLDGLYKEGYDLRVIDIYQDPSPPGTTRISAAPMLIREYPLPILRIGSDFSSAESIRRMLSARKV